MLIISLILLIISTYGYMIFFTNKFKIRIEFMFALFTATCSNILMLAGVLNVLLLSSILIFIGGIFLWYPIYKNKNVLHKRDTILLLFLTVILFYFAFLLKGSLVTSYDNFSHWALVVKNMLQYNEFPNFQDTLIEFQAYPLGSSVFIYYICLILGKSDGCILFGQIFMIISMLFCSSVFITKKNWCLIIIVSICNVYLLIANISIYDLLVDTLLPVCGIASFVVCFYYKEDLKRALFTSLLINILLVNLKNSGLFFSIICSFLLILFCWSTVKSKKVLFKNIIVYHILPVIMFVYLWKKHVELVFQAGNLTKHAMTLDNFKMVESSKTLGDIRTIFINFKAILFSTDNSNVCMLFFISITIIILFICHFKSKNSEECKNDIKILICCVSISILYQISLLLMYVFTMPLHEAINMASYERYCISLSMYIYGIVMIYAIVCLKQIKYYRITCLLLLLIAILPLVQNKSKLSSLYEKPSFENSVRYQFQELLSEYKIPIKSKYFIYQSNEDYGYLYYLGKYELESNDILSVNSSNVSEEIKRVYDYDYIIIWDFDITIENLLKEQQLYNDNLKSFTVIQINNGT